MTVDKREQIINLVNAALAEVGQPEPYWFADEDDREELSVFPPVDMPKDQFVVYAPFLERAVNMAHERYGWPGYEADYD